MKATRGEKQGGSARLDALLAALADPTRREIIARLARGPARVTEVAEPFGVSLNAISKHVQVLEESGIVQRRIAGRDHFLSLNLEPLDEVDKWIVQTRDYWSSRVDALEKLIREKKKRRGHGEKG